jgi:hypothetical protein
LAAVQVLEGKKNGNPPILKIIYTETLMSLDIAEEIVPKSTKSLENDLKFIDVGPWDNQRNDSSLAWSAAAVA